MPNVGDDDLHGLEQPLRVVMALEYGLAVCLIETYRLARRALALLDPLGLSLALV